jgi:hypothetical protein
MGKPSLAPALPMGFKYDPDASLSENAKGAWETELDKRRMQGAHNMRVLARRVFRTDHFEVIYQENAPDVPTIEVDDELVAWGAGEFHLIEFCRDCTKEWKARKFSSLAGFGRVIAERDVDEAFVCRNCQYVEALAGLKK